MYCVTVYCLSFTCFIVFCMSFIAVVYVLSCIIQCSCSLCNVVICWNCNNILHSGKKKEKEKKKITSLCRPSSFVGQPNVYLWFCIDSELHYCMGVRLQLTRFPVMDNCVFLLYLANARLVVSEILPTTLNYSWTFWRCFGWKTQQLLMGVFKLPSR